MFQIYQTESILVTLRTQLEGPTRGHTVSVRKGSRGFQRASVTEVCPFELLDNYDQQLQRLDQHQNMRDLIGSAKRDPFSAALCTFSHKWRVLELRCTLEMGLFQIKGDDNAI
jgi:hypothetical protein